MSQFTRQTGIYKGIVIDNEDPAGLNRVKVRVLELHGLMEVATYGSLKYSVASKSLRVDDDNLPWAEVCYPFGETTPPELNQVVWVTFYGANGEYPVIIGWTGYEYTTKEQPFD